MPGVDSKTALFNELTRMAARKIYVLPAWGPTAQGTCGCLDKANCKCPVKHPYRPFVPHGCNDATIDPSVIKDWVARGGINLNWCLATGRQLADGKWLICLDIDPRNGGDETLGDLEAKHGRLPETVRELTCNGGQHYMFKTAAQISGRTVGPGIDLKSRGGYIVSAVGGSRGIVIGTTTIKPYLFEADHSFDDIEIADAPDWLIEGAPKTQDRPGWDGSGAKDTLLGEAFHLAGLLGDKLQNGVWAVKCLWAHEHSDGRGQGKDSSSVILPSIQGTTFGSFVCSHSHCNHRTWSEVLKALPPIAVAAAKAKYPLRPALIKTADASPEVPAPDPALTMGSMLAFKNNSTELVPDMVNIITVLTYDPRWLVDGHSLLRWDDFGQQVKFTIKPPWHPDDAPAQWVDHWRDEDTFRLMAWFRRNYNSTLPDTLLYQAVQVVARREASHPVREWLQTISWDGIPRVNTWLTKYIGVTDSEYTRNVGRWWLVSACARVMRPGCKADYLLILEGAQGIRKSTAIETLCMQRSWFSDTPFEIGSKDAYLALRGRWIVELAELDSLNRSDSSRAKCFFSSPQDSYRPPYARETIDVPRQCVFIGSVNHTSYLRDTSGNRRYWPVRCGKIDLELLRQDREQIWAEALHMLGQGEKWWPATPEESRQCNEEQEERNEQDAWFEPIAHWCETAEGIEIRMRRDSIHHVGGYFTLGDILGRGIRLDASKWDRIAQLRASNIMAAVGFKRVRWEKQYVFALNR